MSIQDIGIVIDLTKGTFMNTMNKDGKLQLAELGLDAKDKIIYAKEGYWESAPIIIQDKIRAFNNLVKTFTKTGNASYKNYVRVSDDGYTWDDYIEVDETNAVTNDSSKKFAMIKVEIFGGIGDIEITIDDFLQSGLYDTDFVDGSNGLKLIKERIFYASEDESYAGEGKLFIASVTKDGYKKINSISIDVKERMI